MRDELRQSFTLLPRGSDRRLGITKPSKSCVKKFIGGGTTPAGALSVERPAKNELCRTIVFYAHLSEPMVDKCGLSDPSPGNDCNDIYMLARPCLMQEGELLLPTKNIPPANGPSSQRNF